MHKEENKYYDLAVDYINSTNRNIYLTGKAGTGKTTFLRNIQKNCYKKLVIAAPTGVAAMNAGGVTLHSLFQLPLTGFIPESSDHNFVAGEFHNRHSLLKHLRLNKSKRSLLMELELMVIDEVSMLRADILDAVNVILQSIRKSPLPFGGVQVLFIGDLYQLPPVTKNRDWTVLRNYYSTPSFYAAKVLSEPPVYIELNKIYRQNEQNFIDILNKLRNNDMDIESLEKLNSHYNPNFEPQKSGEYITLTTHNVSADVINKESLQKLEGELHTFDASISGDFNESTVVAETSLKLKEGAQIIFIRNDGGEKPRYYNGKTGVIGKIEGEDIYVSFKGEEGHFKVEKEEWHNVRYTLNDETKEVEEDIKGTFTQFPIRLAWAITIHKSQGLTFEKAIIDAGESFAPGQVYVALSRLTSLDGLILKSKIGLESISNDPAAVAFSASKRDYSTLSSSLLSDQVQFVHGMLHTAFDFNQLRYEAVEYLTALREKNVPNKQAAMALFTGIANSILDHLTTADKFKRQLVGLWETGGDDDYLTLKNRVLAAVEYFKREFEVGVVTPLEEYRAGLKLKSRVKKHLRETEGFAQTVSAVMYALDESVDLVSGLNDLENLRVVFDKMALDRLKRRKELVQSQAVTKRKKGDTQRLSLQMYRDGKTLQEIAQDRGLTESTIHGHLLSFVGTEFELHDLIPEQKVDAIMKAMDDNKEASTGTLKRVLGDDYSYAEIGAVMKYVSAD